MSRTIFCTFLQREAEGQDFQLYPGELGKRIYNEISKEAWAQWQHKQTMLINEKKLNMMNAEHRKLLEQEMMNAMTLRVPLTVEVKKGASWYDAH